MSDTQPNPAPTSVKMTLEHDIKAGDTVIHAAGAEILVSKPMGGALRGVNLGGLVRMDFDQIAMVAPRVTMPPLVAGLPNVDPADVMQLGGILVDFLLPTAAKEALFPSG